jgi:lipoate-protein ligase B
MLCVETVAVYCEDRTEHTDTLCGQNIEVWCVDAGGTYSYHWTVKGFFAISTLL